MKDDPKEVTEEVHKCEICSKSFVEKRYLTKHVKRAHPGGQTKKKKDNSMQCPICKKSFPRFSHVARHQLSCMNIRSFECPFCEEKFQQKAHLLRHVGRKHPDEKKSKLQESLRLADVKKPIRLKENQPSTSQTCQDLVHRHLCIKCGHIFTEKHDLLKHIRNLHHPLVCHHCNRIFYGNAALKKHELLTRTARYTCSCGASFTTIRILKNHENACRRRGEFQCIQDECRQLFCQRIQLDRHWNKSHFTEKSCKECFFEAAGPLKLSNHMEETHNRKMCGYCGEKNPDEKHIPSVHWRRLKRTISLAKKSRPVRPQTPKGVPFEIKMEPPDSENEEEETKKELEEEKDEQESKKVPESMENVDNANEEHLDQETVEKEVEPPPKMPSPRRNVQETILERTCSEEEHFPCPLPSYEFDLGEESSLQGDQRTTQSDGNPEAAGSEIPSIFFPAEENEHNAVINLVVQIPPKCTRLVLADHLTNELALTFPELKNSNVLISENFQGRLLSLFIPISSHNGSEIQKWTHSPIYL